MNVDKSKIYIYHFFLIVFLCCFIKNIKVNAQTMSEDFGEEIQERGCQTELRIEQIEYMSNKRFARASDCEYNSNEIFSIPLALHIVRSSYKQGGLGLSEINTAIEDLNDLYSQAKFEFTACSINYIDDDLYFHSFMNKEYKYSSLEIKMKNASNYIDGYINVYFVQNSGGSWSSFPSYLNLPHPEAPKDWIVMNNSQVKIPDESQPNNYYISGAVLAHEIGHYFNLYHTHQTSVTDVRGGITIQYNELVEGVEGNGCGPNYGDELCDTPAEPGTNSRGYNGLSGCVDKSCEYKCGEPEDEKGIKYALKDNNNIMSYTRYSCRSFFSAGQIDRMRSSFICDRDYLLSGCINAEPLIEACSDRDKRALEALYAETNGANWVSPWNLGNQMNTWTGVTLNGNGCVVGLDLTSRNLNGSLPSEIGDLLDLETLRLNYNTLSGKIPKEIGSLNKLKTLFISNNDLSGKIPPSIQFLTNLENLNLSYNKITGDMPEEIVRLDALNTLSLTNNNLSGCYKPPLIELCSKFSNNSISLSNNFNSSWGAFCSSNSGICSDGSRMTDSLSLVSVFEALQAPDWAWEPNCPMNYWFAVNKIPSHFTGRVKKIDFLNYGFLSEDAFLSPDIGKIHYLYKIDLNQDIEINEPIPSEIGDLQYLNELTLKNIVFTHDKLPEEIGNLSNLEILYLIGENKDSTVINEIDEIASFITSLTNLSHIAITEFTGHLPKELASLTTLFKVNLCYNSLSGCFNPTFENWCDRKWTTQSGFCLEDSRGNNNFNATFEEFCATGRGTCSEVCQPVIDLETQTLHGNQTHHSMQLTRSEGTFKKDAAVNLKSEEKISLFGGFKVESGGCLNAVIQPCD